jgi:hypothetical protein
MKPTVLTVALVLIVAGQSRAEIRVALSVEWLACKSEVVVVGKIKTINVAKGVHSVIYEDWTVKIDEVIKGDTKGEELVFCLRTLSAEPSAKVLMTSKEGLLMFLSKSTDHGPERHLDNKLVPVSMQSRFSILDLSNVPGDVYTKEMRSLTDPNEILKIVRTWARSKIVHSLWSEVPCESPIFEHLYGGSACYLIVPAEEKYRAHFMKLAQSDKPHERQEAASELYKFPGEDTERVLRGLLDDKTENVWLFSADTIARVEFGVRAAACQSLKALGRPVPKMELERVPTNEEQRSLRQSRWRKSFTEALSEEWKVISVDDGGVRKVEGRDMIAVIVTCGREALRCKLTLVPKEWDRKDFPGGEALGINGRDSQGARYFFLEGNLPEAVKVKLIKYFGLERDIRSHHP